MRIRDAKPNDSAQIAPLLNHIIRETTITFNSIDVSSEDVEDAIAAADVYLVLERGESILGFATYGPFRNGRGYATVKEHSICLHPDAQRSGQGTNLLRELEDRARALGVRHMIAGVSGENAAGIKFHARIGYKSVGTLPGIGQKFDRPIDLVLMQKSL